MPKTLSFVYMRHTITCSSTNHWHLSRRFGQSCLDGMCEPFGSHTSYDACNQSDRKSTHQMPAIGAVRLGLLWRRLDGIVDQVSETFVRAAFSVVVRDNYDMAFSLFDARGLQITQSKRSIPSFMGTLPRTLVAVRERFPESKLRPGDTIISNNAWIGTGHLNDISMVHPVFRDGQIVAYAASTAHTVDIGGAPSPAAKDCFEEGLCIPICKIVEASTILHIGMHKPSSKQSFAAGEGAPPISTVWAVLAAYATI